MTTVHQEKDILEPFARPSQWDRLSVVPEKPEFFSKDLYFRECWADMAAIMGPDMMNMLGSLAMLNVKPDAVVGRRMKRVFDFLIENGFVPITATPLQLTRHSIRELWRYDWHVYTVDRLAFSTVWYTSADILMFIVRDCHWQGTLPASVRLSSLKGNAIAEKRLPTDLRSLLQPPNQILNFVHVAEEPADIVRELGIFFDRPQRRTLLNEITSNINIGSDRSRHVLEEIARLEARYAEHDLDISASLQRIENVLGPMQRIRELLDTNEKVSWDEVCSLLDPMSKKIDSWDFICVVSSLIHYEREVPASDMFSKVDVKKWKEMPR